MSERLTAGWYFDCDGIPTWFDGECLCYPNGARVTPVPLSQLKGPLVAQDWPPIETAPKDGTRILIYSPVDGVASSHWSGGAWQNLPVYMDVEDRNRAKPTHWMPLPAGPAPEGERA